VVEPPTNFFGIEIGGEPSLVMTNQPAAGTAKEIENFRE
jgi:hypothetical protein